ncbi:hypothetical protein E1281_08360 [Actinomadura sp. KC345]|uniref:hypothetical protein n=1 Tax=Actinomadura sp. KC345 TaxID=2530371 RepID=UPI00104A889F|nr:hypothetical protein [Actinomadura sp. KC345]TDC56196.1 hypothetical protein E1281_08360 [Actinomadura sp. KC345]
MMRCLLLGHDHRFTAEGETMRWHCARGCGTGGEKVYPTASDARRYARAFDRKDTEDAGKRAPLIGLFPLRLLRAMRGRRDA